MKLKKPESEKRSGSSIAPPTQALESKREEKQKQHRILALVEVEKNGKKAEAKNGSSPERPILLRVETKAGHGQGKPVTKQIEEWTDIYSFLFWQLRMKL